MRSATPDTPFSAIIMAADRNPGDPVTRAAGVACKALAPVGGTPMVFRVLHALEESLEVGTRLLCGPPQPVLEQATLLKSGVDTGNYGWTDSCESPSASAAAALAQLPESQPVLLTTADHALLSSQIIDYFCGQARTADVDLMVALAPHDLVATAYPSMKRTRLRFSDRDYCSCNLFAFMTPRARAITGFWSKVESQRKRPWRVIGILGWWPVFRYLLGYLSLEEALGRLSRRLDMKIGAAILPYAEAAVDVDSIHDWQLVQQVLAEKKSPGQSV
ncbi:MAG: nucleotidyltransferase family protein [Gammaproteobacteria bacterium]|jgi:GTP:adenosylcobinamide-phosphate guanylyltransferase|nr:nucleotidyltransferase family protein [Gammaproteobacteria bacterium]